MEDLNASLKEYDTYGESYFTNIPTRDYSDTSVQTVMDENFTFNGSVPYANTSTANVSQISYPRDEFLAKIEQSVLGLIFILTISGNFLVLMGIYCRNQKMTRMYYFILHLSIADLTTAVFNVLTQLAWEFTGRFQGGAFMCKFVKYSQIVGPYSSSYILVMTALDRYQAICFPLSNCSWTAGRSKFMLGTAWALSFAFCLPQLHIFNYQEMTPGVFECWGTFEPHWGEKAYITWYCITVFIIPLIILIFAYTCITRVIWLNFSMKNAILKEERPSKGLRRGDSDDVEDSNVDEKSFEENENSVFRGRGKYASEKLTNAKNNRKSLMARACESSSAKNLEVCWHQRKQGTQTRASLKIANPNLLPVSHNNRCLSCSESLSGENNKDITALGPPSTCQPLYSNNEEKDPLKQKHSLLSFSHDESHATIMANGTIHSHGKLHRDDKGLASDRRQKWRSMSAKFNTPNHAGVNNPEVDLDGSNGDYGKKASKHHLLGTFQKGQKPSRQSQVVKKSSTMSSNQPRTHSVKGISRAKIKTVKLTVTVICCYIICSTPFIAALLWSAYDPYAKEHPFFFGPTFTILTLLASLNSCVNAWIVLFFNPNLLQGFVRGTCRRKFGARDRPGGMNSTMSMSRRPQSNKNVLVTTATSVSPLMSRFSKADNFQSHRSSGGRETMELIPPGVNTSRSESLSSGEGRNGKTDRKYRDATIPIETSFIAI